MRLFRTQPRIALAADADAPAIASLYERAWAEHLGQVDERLVRDQAPLADEVAAWLRGGFEVFTGTVDGDLVGVVRCSFPTGTCLVDRMEVEPGRDGNGSRRARARHALQQASRRGGTR